jgi:hypothetical protein
MEPYSTELRGEVLAACDRNEGTRVIAVRFKVSESWVRRVKQRRRETGQIAPKTAAPSPPKWQAWSAWLLAKIAARPDIYLRELQAELKQELGETACLMTICNACRYCEGYCAVFPAMEKRGCWWGCSRTRITSARPPIKISSRDNPTAASP